VSIQPFHFSEPTERKIVNLFNFHSDRNRDVLFRQAYKTLQPIQPLPPLPNITPSPPQSINNQQPTSNPMINLFQPPTLPASKEPRNKLWEGLIIWPEIKPRNPGGQPEINNKQLLVKAMSFSTIGEGGAQNEDLM
jgi:hypothetical protein